MRLIERSFFVVVAMFIVTAAVPAIAQSPYTLTRSLYTSNVPAQADSNEGFVVATDGNYAVVGVPNADGESPREGVVRVYDAVSGALIVTLRSPTPVAFDYFGTAVAISGTRVVVGASGVDVGDLTDPNSAAFDAGAAYVFNLTGNTPTVPIAVLPNPAPRLGDSFGQAVSISGSRVVVGAPYDDAGATDAGTAYVFDVAGATPAVPIAVLNKPVPTESDLFAYSVAISGTRVLIGALADDTGALNAGAAYLFDLASATPTLPVAVLQNPAPAEFNFFGNAVAISGARAVIGEYASDVGGENTGAAFVYDFSGATPAVPVAVLRSPSPAPGDLFGRSVSISGTRLAVGAPGAEKAGNVYAYIFGSTTPLITLRNPAPAESDFFGGAVAITGAHLLVGAPFDDTIGSDNGAMYVFDPAVTLTYALWRAARFTPAEIVNPAITGRLADPDNDGLVNAFEYAFGLPPTAPSNSGLPLASVKNVSGTLYLTLAFRRLGASDLQYTPLTSGSLSGGWAANAVQVGAAIPNDDGSETVTYRDSVPYGSGSRFMRLQVTITP